MDDTFISPPPGHTPAPEQVHRDFTSIPDVFRLYDLDKADRKESAVVTPLTLVPEPE